MMRDRWFSTTLLSTMHLWKTLRDVWKHKEKFVLHENNNYLTYIRFSPEGPVCIAGNAGNLEADLGLCSKVHRGASPKGAHSSPKCYIVQYAQPAAWCCCRQRQPPFFTVPTSSAQYRPAAQITKVALWSVAFCRNLVNREIGMSI